VIGSIWVVSFATSSVLGAKLSLPSAKRVKLDELKQGLQPPYLLDVDTTTLTYLYNILQVNEKFEWFCEAFGRGGVAKLRSWIGLKDKEINPTMIEVDLDKRKLFYHAVGASGFDLTEGKNWAGNDLEDVANALSYAKSFLLVAANARQQFLTRNASWRDTLAFCSVLEQSPLTTPEMKWSLRGVLFSPQSEPDTQLASLKKDDPDLSKYGETVKAEWAASRTITGRIVDFSNPMEVQVAATAGAPVTYKGFEFAVDVNRQPVNTTSLGLISDKSDKGVLADVRYVEENGERLIVNSQLRNVTASLIDAMQKWDGSYTSAAAIIDEVETTTGKAAVRGPILRVARNKPRVVKDSLGLTWHRD